MKIDDVQLIKRILEAAIMASDTPLSKKAIKELFDDLERPVDELLNQALDQLAVECDTRGYELIQVASGYRFQVKQDLSKWIAKLWKEKTPRYSRALLETLSLIAYRQPITRGEIESIRGVAVSSQIIRTLLEREWVKAVGHRDVPGRPAIYATTKVFLDYFNLKTLDQLPPLSEIRDLNAISRDFNIELPLALKEEMEQGETNAAEEPDSLTSDNRAMLESATDEQRDGAPSLSVVGDSDDTASIDQEADERVSSEAGIEIKDQKLGDLESIDREDTPTSDEEVRDEADTADGSAGSNSDENGIFNEWVASGLTDAK